jgi:hypothetical protein
MPVFIGGFETSESLGFESSSAKALISFLASFPGTALS